MVVAGEHDDAAVLRGSRVVRVLEDVAAAVDTRSLAVPHREDPVVLGARVEVDLLRSPQRGRGEILVEAGLELDVSALEELRCLPQRLVERAERRPAVAGYEARGVEARERVALALQDQEPDERLRAGQVDAAGLQRVLVIEGNFAQRGGGSSH